MDSKELKTTAQLHDKELKKGYTRVYTPNKITLSKEENSFLDSWVTGKEKARLTDGR